MSPKRATSFYPTSLCAGEVERIVPRSRYVADTALSHGLRAQQLPLLAAGPTETLPVASLGCMASLRTARISPLSQSGTAPTRTNTLQFQVLGHHVRPPFDRDDLFHQCPWRPAHRIGHGGVQRDPATFLKNLQINVAKEVLPEWIGSGEHQPHRMPDRLQHRPKQDGHVVAVAGAQLQHASLRSAALPLGKVSLDVAHVLLHPLEQCLDLAQVIFGFDCSL